MWGAQVDVLRYQGCRVILPDLRGHGRSPVADEPATMQRCAADVAELLDELSIDRFVLGGFSLGGYVALEFARQHPGRLEGLLLVDTRAEPDSEDAKAKRYETAQAVRREGIGVLETSMIPKLLSERTRIERRDLMDQVRSMIRATSPEGAARALEGMAERPDQRPHLAALKIPTLIVVGEKDELTPPDASRAMAKAIHGSRLAIVPQAAHLVPLEAPHALNGALSSWFDEDVGATRAAKRVPDARSARQR